MFQDSLTNKDFKSKECSRGNDFASFGYKNTTCLKPLHEGLVDMSIEQQLPDLLRQNPKPDFSSELSKSLWSRGAGLRLQV